LLQKLEINIILFYNKTLVINGYRQRHFVKPFKSLRQSITSLNVEEHVYPIWKRLVQHVGYSYVNRSTFDENMSGTDFHIFVPN